MFLFNIQHMCTNDGPGIRTTVFFKGCPLNCVWCHNPEGKSDKPVLNYSPNLCIGCHKCEKVCKQGAHSGLNGKKIIERQKCICCSKCVNECPTGSLEIYGKKWSITEVLNEVCRDRIFYGEKGGVTLSGGEPFSQPQVLFELLRSLKEKGINICIETCGFTSEKNIVEASRYTDTFLYDYKETSNELHKQFTGVDPKVINNNLYVLDREAATVILRCPIIPGCNMREEHFIGIGEVAKNHSCIKSVELEPYHPLGIGKAEQIGEKVEYLNKDFLKKETLSGAAKMIRQICNKPVSIN